VTERTGSSSDVLEVAILQPAVRDVYSKHDPWNANLKAPLQLGI